MSLVITLLGGNCPVQGEGIINELPGEPAAVPFYFRARGERWQMWIGGDLALEAEWHKVERWGNGPFDAGWMPEEVAREIIEECAEQFSRERRMGKIEQ